MSLKYTTVSVGSTIADSEFDALADDAAAVSGALSNDGASEKFVLANYKITIGTQGAARAADAQVSLLIVPEVNGAYGDVATLRTAQNYIAYTYNGVACTATLDAAVTARDITFYGVLLPNSNYKVGILNESGQALAGSSVNSIYEVIYTYENV